MKTDLPVPVIGAILVLGGLLALSPAAAVDPATAAAWRHRLHQQQLQDRLSLDLQQKIAPGRPGLLQSDKLRLDRLELDQRMEQQRLELEQLADFQRFADDPERARIHQRAYDRARETQLQRFYLERQRLLGSMKAAPLQPGAKPGQLRLP